MLWFTSYWANQQQSLSVWVNNAYGFVASFNQLDSTHSIFMNKIIHQMFHISFHQSLNVLTYSYDWIGYYWHRAKREPNVCVSYWQSEMCSGCQRLSSGSDWKEQSIFLWFEIFLFSFPFQDDERWMVSWIRDWLVCMLAYWLQFVECHHYCGMIAQCARTLHDAFQCSVIFVCVFFSVQLKEEEKR